MRDALYPMDDSITEVHNHLKAAMTLAETAMLPPFLVYLIAMAAKEAEHQRAESIKAAANEAK